MNSNTDLEKTDPVKEAKAQAARGDFDPPAQRRLCPPPRREVITSLRGIYLTLPESVLYLKYGQHVQYIEE